MEVISVPASEPRPTSSAGSAAPAAALNPSASFFLAAVRRSSSKRAAKGDLSAVTTCQPRERASRM